MRARFTVVLAVLCGLWTGAIAQAEGGVTFESLLRETTDLSLLARFPEPAYTTKQFSSYDRRSTDPAVQTDENWYANADRGQHLRSEEINGEKVKVLMDAEGPGAIVHFWSANPDDAGDVRIYLDGAETPVIDTPLSGWLGGKHELGPKPLSVELSRGWNSYIPIPYAKHCKVVTTKGDFYYIINYRTYPAGTAVESFTPAIGKTNLALINETAAQLAKPGEVVTPGQDKGSQQIIDAEVGGGKDKDLAALTGPGAIAAISVRLEGENLEAILRGAILEISFDEASVPQVNVPLGDFFGGAPGISPFTSLSCGAEKKGVLYSKWVMPYAKDARIRIVNHTRETLAAQFAIATMPWTWDDNSLHLHATWRGELQIPTRPRQDWNFVEAAGRGRYVGTMLHIANPVKDWWGEGDEKIYVDGEAFPSHFGTGSEDYFCYAWCSPELHTQAYHNQPRCDGPANYGHTCVNRFHIMDNIPFTKSVKFDIEVWHWAETKVDMFGTSWWYAAPGATSNRSSIETDKLVVPKIEPYPIKKVAGALEGEDLKILSKTGGQTSVQGGGGWDWSNEAQLWWVDNQPGHKLELEFPVEKKGSYEVFAVLTKAVDYGIAQLYINGKKAGDAIDCYRDGVKPTKELSLGTHEMKKGAQVLTVEITGKNEKAVAKYMFGLDYLRLVTAK